MRKKTLSAIALASLMMFAVPSVAQAATDDNYTPVTPNGPSLAGSTAVGDCSGGAPSIDYTVRLTHPAAGSSTSASLVLTDGANTTDIPLGQLQGGSLSGSVAWPTALWTRGDVDASLVVGTQQLSVPLSYPNQGACATSGVSGISTVNRSAAGSDSSALPATGMSEAVLPIGIAGGVLALLGAGLLITRRLIRR